MIPIHPNPSHLPPRTVIHFQRKKKASPESKFWKCHILVQDNNLTQSKTIGPQLDMLSHLKTFSKFQIELFYNHIFKVGYSFPKAITVKTVEIRQKRGRIGRSSHINCLMLCLCRQLKCRSLRTKLFWVR